MDHRVGQRSQCALPVVLHKRDGQLIYGEIRDISAGGAYVSIPKKHATPRGLIKLVFEAALPDETLCEWWGLVLRTDAGGIGVMFDQRHDEAAPCRVGRPQPPASVAQKLGAL